MIRKDWSLCDQNLQFVAILHKKLKIFIFFVFLRFYKIFFIVIFDHSFPTIQNLLNLFKYPKSWSKILLQWIQKSYFRHKEIKSTVVTTSYFVHCDTSLQNSTYIIRKCDSYYCIVGCSITRLLLQDITSLLQSATNTRSFKTFLKKS